MSLLDVCLILALSYTDSSTLLKRVTYLPDKDTYESWSVICRSLRLLNANFQTTANSTKLRIKYKIKYKRIR